METDSRRTPDYLKKTIVPAQVEAMKDRLGTLLPDVKASDRVEALARGLGFGSWAAARAWMKAETIAYIDLEPTAFTSYLSERGKEVPGIALASVYSLCRPLIDGSICSIKNALYSMGQETWDAMFTGYHDYEDGLNEQIRFVKRALLAAAEREQVRQMRRVAETIREAGFEDLAGEYLGKAEKFEEILEFKEDLRAMIGRGELLDMQKVKAAIQERFPRTP